MTPLIRAQTASVRTPSGHAAADALSWEVHAGQRWAVIGRNAVGKSSLLRALSGLHPTPGIAAQPSALLPQHSSDRFALSVAQYLALHHPAGDAAPRQLLDDLDIAPLAQRAITALSGGERQRVGLAAVAQQGRALWLLDEPISQQDPSHQHIVGRWIASARAQERATVMVVHDLPWAQTHCTHLLALLGQGRWQALAVADCTPELLQDAYGCPWQQLGRLWMPA